MDVTANKRNLFYSKPTLSSLPDFCNSFSNDKIKKNFQTKKKIVFQTLGNYVKLFYEILVRSKFLKSAEI